MTKKELKNAFHRYNESKYTSVNEFYKKPSYYKEKAEYLILENMKKVNGYGYKVVGGNCSHFTAGWLYDENDKLIFVYETYANTYKLEV